MQLAVYDDHNSNVYIERQFWLVSYSTVPIFTCVFMSECTLTPMYDVLPILLSSF